MDLDSPIGRYCQKCRHVRRREDTGPDFACPACGAIYAKVRAVVQQREEADREAARHADFSVRQPLEGASRPALPRSLAEQRRRVGLVRTGYLLQALPLGVTAVAGAWIVKGIADEDPSHWLASHSRWQLRTFWSALVIGLVLLAIAVLLIGAGQLADRMGDAPPSGRSAARWLWLPAFALWLWVLARVARGWLALLRGDTA